MKKGIIVLLIAVLVAGFAFADGTAGEVTFTGDATISYDYHLDRKDTGIQNAQDTTFSFEFDFCTATGESKGEGKLYAEIAATAKVYLEYDENDFTDVSLDVEISKANIVAGDVTIDILGPKGLYSFAELYADDKFDDGAVKSEDPTFLFKISDLDLGDHGFRVLYKDYEASFAFWRYGDNDLVGAPAPQTSAYAGLKTPAYKLAEGMTLTAGANFYFNKVDAADDALMFVGGGFKFAYAPEGSKLSASLATDALAIIYGDDNILPIDIAAQVKYDFITADVYFFTLDKFDKDYLDILAAKVSVSKDVNDSLSVGGYAEVLYYEFLGFDLKPEFRFGANVTYKAEKFTAKASVDAWLKYVNDAYTLQGGDYFTKGAKPGLGITAEIFSTAIIDNATVGLKWSGSDLSVKNADDELIKLGKISAYIKVAF